MKQGQGLYLCGERARWWGLVNGRLQPTDPWPTVEEIRREMALDSAWSPALKPHCAVTMREG